jgi:hypothetical protein
MVSARFEVDLPACCSGEHVLPDKVNYLPRIRQLRGSNTVIYSWGDRRSRLSLLSTKSVRGGTFSPSNRRFTPFSLAGRLPDK